MFIESEPGIQKIVSFRQACRGPRRPPHGSRRAALPRRALTLGDGGQTAPLAMDARCGAGEASDTPACPSAPSLSGPAGFAAEGRGCQCRVTWARKASRAQVLVGTA